MNDSENSKAYRRKRKRTDIAAYLAALGLKRSGGCKPTSSSTVAATCRSNTVQNHSLVDGLKFSVIIAREAYLQTNDAATTTRPSGSKC